jgi:hypothetical protein
MPPEVRRILKLSIAFRLILAGGALLFAGTAGADQLCSRSFESLSQLYADLHNSTGAGRIYLEFATHVVIVERDITWVFVKDSHPASPAALCRWGQSNERIESRCAGRKGACDAFVAKFSGNDWRGPIPK